MKLVGAISTAVLSLSLGICIPAYAQQDQHDQQEEPKAKPAQDEKKAQPEKPAKAEEKNAQQDEKGTKPEEKNAQPERNTKEEKNAQEQHTQQAKPEQQSQRSNNNGGGRIPADRYKANFGQEHRFRVSQSDYNNRRFQYGGYWFGFEGVWPSNWLYTQDVYVVEIDGVYYLCNANYPGVNIMLSVTL
jgi:cytoskeletal protein RodZ